MKYNVMSTKRTLVKPLLCLLLPALAVIALHSAFATDDALLGRPARAATAGETDPEPWLNPTQINANLYGVTYASPTMAVAVGEGTIVRSTDGGYTWDVLPSPTQVKLRAVSFADETTGTAVGDNGTILYTTDGGDSWTAQASGTNLQLTGVSITDPLTGTAVGEVGTILRTTDGGVTWIPQTGGTPSDLYDVDFIDSLTGVVVGNGMWWTDDGGATWVPKEYEHGFGRLRSVDLVDSSTCFAAGEIWSGCYDGDVCPWVRLVKTTDAGATWSNRSLWGIGRLKSIAMGDSLVGAAVGEIYDDYGLGMGNTYNGGASWTHRGVSLMDAIAFGDGLTACTVGRGGHIYFTLNGGRSWIQRSPIAPPLPPPIITSFRAYPDAGQVRLTWLVRYPETVVGFGLLRESEGSEDVWLPDADGLFHPLVRSFVDYGVEPETNYTYTLIAHLTPAGEIRSGPIQVATPPIPMVYGFSADAGLDSVRLDWQITEPDSIVGFRLRKRIGGEDVWLPAADSLFGPSARAFVDYGVERETTYAYQLFAWLTSGAEETSPLLIITTPRAPIHSLKATVDFDLVRLFWGIDPPDPILGCRLLRESEGTAGVWLPAADSLLDPSTGWYDDHDVEPGNTFAYTVIAPLISGEDYRSAPLPVTVPALPAITEFGATPEGDLVRLAWQVAPRERVEGYQLVRARAGTDDVLIPSTTTFELWVLDYVDEELEVGVDYTYTLVVHLLSNAYGGEVRSDSLVVTTFAVPAFSAFEATPETDRVHLEWDVDTIENIDGFRILRESDKLVFDAWLPDDTLLAPSARSFDDAGVEPGRGYAYTVVAFLELGGEVRTQTVFVTTPSVAPLTYALGQNYPNPFNPETEIPYALPEAARVTLEVFDTAGRRVRVLVDENQDAGHQSAPWDGLSDAGGRVASGIYFYRLRAGGYTETRKMVLLR